MDALNPIHVLVLLTVVAVLYAAWMMYFTMRESRRANGKEREDGKTASVSDNQGRDDDIMGKSKFVLPQSVSVPHATVGTETESDTEKANTFVPEKVPDHPRQVAPDELDDVFGNPPEGEKNEPLEIEQPLYVEQPPFPEEYADDDENENEELPLRGQTPAQGVSYENLGEAYRRVVHNPSLTSKEEEETGRILLEMRRTDMFEYIVSGDPKRENRVYDLMETYLAAFQKRIAEREAGSPTSQNEVAALQGFSVLDYV